jgi:hypothetical protein
MWSLTNHTQYSAERNWTRDKTGVHHWVVAVKATFDIDRNGKLSLADEQEPPLLAPEYRGDPATSSLLAESDLLYVKPRTDVLLDAHAHAPKGRAAATVPVSLRVGDIEKTLLVHGTRVYYRGAVGMTTSAPRPFVTAPIQWESAFGGTDTTHPDARKHRIDARNPVGRGLVVDPTRLDNQLAHTIEYPNGNPAKVGPAGFGPLASFWSPRLERAGTYDERWARSKKPLLPDDYDDRFANAAPEDQQPAKPLRGGEPIAVVNMTPEGVLRFELPKIFLAFSSKIRGRVEEHRARLATVFIALERMKLSLVWQSTLMVPQKQVDYLDTTVIREKRYL